MSKKNIWISPRPDGWAVQRENSDRASHILPTKEEARSVGRDMARQDGVELIIQRKDGTIEERNSYGQDPFPPRG
jgi:uncharacterized protein DUF2188